MRQVLGRLWQVIYSNPISLAGGVTATAAALLYLGGVFFTTAIAEPGNPYVGMLVYVALPALFAAGLVAIPVGHFLMPRRIDDPPISVKLRDSEKGGGLRIILNKGGIIFVFLTFANIAILSVAGYKGVHFMDSVAFCGKLCHTVMSPEFTTYENSAHSRVRCVVCHIGPGADWFVKAKLSGARQVYAVFTGTYSRPIPAPVHNLRPARDTCEQCHWPEKFHGQRLVVKEHFEADEENTQSFNVVMLKVGAGGERAHGIHWHISKDNRIRYISKDDKREEMLWVEYRGPAGKTVEYYSDKIEPEELDLETAEIRVLDCIDCHNRPTHVYELPGPALDRALAQGEISRELPWIRKVGEEALRKGYPDRDAAQVGIEKYITEYYREKMPETAAKMGAKIDEAARAVREIYRRNVFPEMKIEWGTYPNHIGHRNFTGCFRCHDEEHTAKDGRSISQDCDLCHTVLAEEEEEPEFLQLIEE